MGDFLGTGATFGADLNLVLHIAMGLVLIGGMILARTRHYTIHKYVQSSVILLNLPLIAFIMVPSFRDQVEPYVPGQMGTAFYWVASFHAVVGVTAQLLGLYIITAAGTKLLPERFRFQNYKLWMRSMLTLWWVVVLLGIGVYYVWYVAPSSATAKSGSHGAHAFTIAISNFKFTPKVATISPGTTVTWADAGGMHIVQSLSSAHFLSGVLAPGKRYRFTFPKVGVYHYDCGIHGTIMSAEIIVR